MANKRKTPGRSSSTASPSAGKEPRAARPGRDSDRTAGATPPSTPPSGAANYLVPGGLALLLVGTIAVYAARGNRVPAEPGAPTPEPGSAAAEQRPVPTRPQEPPPRPAEPPAPRAESNEITPVHPEPTSPDPRRGRFTLAQATAGMPQGSRLAADIRTSQGTLTCELWPDRAPNTVANFVGLARGKREFWDPVAGQWTKRPYYDGTVFHRVIPDFMIQGGDILRNGRGGPGYEIPDENVARHDEPGLLAMANHGPNTNGSQFFVLEEPKPHLNGSYSVFGKCTPVDLVERIARVPRDPRGDRPLTPVTIEQIRIHR